MSGTCRVCGNPADSSESVTHRECLHLTHIDCIPDGTKPNYKLCGQCSGETPVEVVAAAAAVVSSSSAEPHTDDGVDYVMNPGVKQSESSLRKLGTLILNRGKTEEETVKNSKNPLFLLRNRVPIPTIMKQNKLGLDHFLRSGVTMGDFLNNGYTWKDLQHFEDVAKQGPDRALKVLSIGLRTTANHFRDYPDALPLKLVKEHANFDYHQLGDLFGLSFPDTGPLECDGDVRWNAKECVKLGLRYDDLVDLGMRYTQHYEDLMHGLSDKDAAIAEAALHGGLETDAKVKAAQSKMEKLIDLEKVAREQIAAAAREREAREEAMMLAEQQQEELEEEKVAPVQRSVSQIRQYQPTPPPMIEQQQQEMEYVYVDEEVEEERAPSPPPPQQRRVVVIQRRQQPPPQPQVRAKLPHIPRGPTLTDERSSRYDRHGALF